MPAPPPKKDSLKIHLDGPAERALYWEHIHALYGGDFYFSVQLKCPD